MRKTYLAKRNSLLSSANISWGGFALACAILILLVRVLAPNFFWHMFAPVFGSANALTADSNAYLQRFGNSAVLASKNEELASENAALAIENQALVQRISDIAGLATTSEGILAGVVARPPESPYDTLVVAAGSREGVTPGMEAFGAGAVPLGTVSTVLADFSRVTLFSAPGTDTVGWVGHANVPLTIFGAGAGAIRAVVARSANIAVGDVVYLPGPGRLPVGTVVRIDGAPSSPSVILRIRPALNLFSLSWIQLRNTGAALLISATTTPLL